MNYVQLSKGAVIVSIDILNLRKFYSNKQAIDIALPVLAIECEATPPLENFLDVYEETVLRLVSIGLSAHGIAKALNATESLVDKILIGLKYKEYVQKEKEKPWELSKDGEKYLNGSIISERASSQSQYGYMFINAIKKEILPFFYLGNVGQIPLFRGSSLPLKLTINGNETNTFQQIKINRSKLNRAYKAFFKNLKILKEYDAGEITKEEAVDLFADLESFDEEIEEEEKQSELPEMDKSNIVLNKNMFIRALIKKPEIFYLRMRIIIDPTYPGGYRVESPFDFNGIDNDYFLRQIQWMEQSDEAYLDNRLVKDFLKREICKISPSYKREVKDYEVFLLERVPLLKLFRSQMIYIYDDMERIYSLMQREHSLIEKENIVSNLSRSVVEGLFNNYFRAIDKEVLNQIQKKAFDDISSYGSALYKKHICSNVHLDDNKLQWVGTKYLHDIIKRLSHTYGNSIMEKFINLFILDYYLSDIRVHKFLVQPDINQKYNVIDKLNRIRRKVSHNTDDRFSNEDYNYYIDNAFVLINNLLEAYREDY